MIDTITRKARAEMLANPLNVSKEVVEKMRQQISATMHSALLSSPLERKWFFNNQPDGKIALDMEPETNAALYIVRVDGKDMLSIEPLDAKRPVLGTIMMIGKWNWIPLDIACFDRLNRYNKKFKPQMEEEEER